MTMMEKQSVQTGFNAAAARPVPVESTFLAAAPCNAPLPQEYLSALDTNETAWREAMEYTPSLRR